MTIGAASETRGLMDVGKGYVQGYVYDAEEAKYHNAEHSPEERKGLHDASR